MADIVDRAKLRRVAMSRQGLDRREAFGRDGVNATLNAIKHLGYVQIDTISVVVRAHDHTIHTRVPNFEPFHIDQLLKERKIFEYRFPVAAYRPLEDYRYTLLHADVFRDKPISKDKSMMRRVIDRIRAEGPLRSRDLERAKKKGGGWWDWKPAKLALEQLYYQGELMISHRNGFEKSYDLTERVLPASIDTKKPTPQKFASYLVDTTLRAHGFATRPTFASGARHVPLRNALTSELQRRAGEGCLREFVDDRGVQYWAEPATLDGEILRKNELVRVLSPFDNAVILRERVREVFDFDYLIECYVPESKRVFGYFCLPITYGDYFVGRMDCKSHREQARFEVKSLFLERSFSTRKNVQELAGPLAKAIVEYAGFDACDDVVVSRTQPAIARKILELALKRYL